MVDIRTFIELFFLSPLNNTSRMSKYIPDWWLYLPRKWYYNLVVQEIVTTYVTRTLHLTKNPCWHDTTLVLVWNTSKIFWTLWLLWGLTSKQEEKTWVRKLIDVEDSLRWSPYYTSILLSYDLLVTLEFTNPFVSYDLYVGCTV